MVDVAGGCGAETLANDLVTALSQGQDFTLPDVDLTNPEYQLPSDIGVIGNPISQLTNADLTTGIVGGTGTFDVLMGGFGAHLKGEYTAGRITGAEYSKAYVALTESAMGNAVQYLLGRDSAYWQAVTAQLNAQVAQAEVVKARVQLEASKIQLQALRYEMLTNQATFALTKMKVSTESITYCTGKYSLDNILPAQKLMLSEQMEAQRAQTMDTRSDGTTQIKGSVGKQKELYAQQITSYQRDAEVKAGKLFTDAWITMKTIDEGLTPPSSFVNTSIDQVLSTLKTKNGLTGA